MPENRKTLPHQLEFEFNDRSGNTVHVYANGEVVTFDRNGRPIRHKKSRKPDCYRTPEERMQDIETRMAGIEVRMERLENDGR